MNLGRWLLLAAVFGVVALFGCPPGEEPAEDGDNLGCELEAYPGTVVVRGQIRASFGFEGGDGRCTFEGVPALQCTVSGTVTR